MGCTGCSTGTNADGTPKGCNSNGGCSTGGCNKLNTYDWLSAMDLPDTNDFGFVEVSFKNGSRKSFFQHNPHTYAVTGDTVVVESGAGLDIGKISLSGDLVRLQIKKKRVDIDSIQHKIVRRANERDLERLYEARGKEKSTMVRARAIARSLELDMKIGDVEYQGDKRKATFFYTADGRVDFRELIRQFAKEFKVKIEMRQIGARQESARIGGIGSCGRELCCSTWLTDFRSVSTAAARYQNLAINQAKLSGQCGRLKCCLNYELDTYMDALDAFPKGVDKLKTEVGRASLVKTDIFKRTMYYAYDKEGGGPRGKFFPLSLERVKEISEMNKKGEFPSELVSDKYGALYGGDTPEVSVEFGDDEGLTGVIELPPEERKRRKKKRNNRKKPGQKRPGNQQNKGGGNKGGGKGKPQQNKSSNKPQQKPNNKQGQGGKENDGNKKPNSPNNQRNKNKRNNRNNKPNQNRGNNNNNSGKPNPNKGDNNNKTNNNRNGNHKPSNKGNNDRPKNDDKK